MNKISINRGLVCQIFVGHLQGCLFIVYYFVFIRLMINSSSCKYFTTLSVKIIFVVYAFSISMIIVHDF